MDTYDVFFLFLYFYYFWFCIVIGVVGFIGNTIISYVIVKTKDLHTTVNYYLLSLAVSDMFNSLTEIFVVIFRFSKWVDVYTILTEINTCNNFVVSNWTLSALTIDRYIAVCHPLKSRYLSKMSRTIKIIAAVWTFSLFYCSTNVIKNVAGLCEEGPFCFTLNVWGSLQLYLVVLCLIPAIIIIGLYILIGLKIRNFGRISKQNNIRNTSTKRETTARSGLLLSVAVVVEFLVCSVPYQVAVFMTVNNSFFNGMKLSENKMFFLFLIITRIINIISAVFDPIIFNYFSSKFRKAFAEIKLFPGRRKPRFESATTSEIAALPSSARNVTNAVEKRL